MLSKITKRFYHPGYGNYRMKKLCLPICPNDTLSKYYKPVWGNKIQELQLEDNEFSYNTSEINFYSYKIRDLFNRNTLFVPTSHNTPISTAIKSCRNLKNKNKYLLRLNQLNVTDLDGVFINTIENRNKLMSLTSFTESEKENDILRTAIYGVFSNFGDSIYIANDYLQVSENHVIVSNYPSNVSQREIERCRIVAYNLLFGNYPILLDNHIDFEGEANIKFIPAKVDGEQMCISYNSSRSNINCIDNINKYLSRLRLPKLRHISLYPKYKLRKYFYHLDCIMNFSVDSSKIQQFETASEFWENYKKNGTLLYEQSGFEPRFLDTLNRLFEHMIPVKKEDDLLCANMIVTPSNIVGSSKIKNKNMIDNFYNFNHPSHGGGGAHKCCSNTLNLNSSINIDNWISFCNDIGISVDEYFVEGVETEMERINKYV